jgi:hypothetical protein
MGTASSCTVTMFGAQSVTAKFVPLVGSLTLQLDGLPAGKPVTLTVTGPSGTKFSESLSNGFAYTLSDLAVGTYTVSGSALDVTGTAGPFVYRMIFGAPTQSATVSNNANTIVTLHYTDQPPIARPPLLRETTLAQ